jgi:hydroxyethylthiazole kinase
MKTSDSDFGMQTIVSLLKLRPTLIRGNASEIMAVAGAAGATTRGVDSTAATSDALASGKKLAQEYGCIVGISGADDLVSIFANASRDFKLRD